jgi:hypothetical protein
MTSEVVHGRQTDKPYSMRVSVFSSAIALGAAVATANPFAPVNNLLNLDFNDMNIKQALLSAMNLLPMDVNVWEMNRTAGIVGVDMKVDISELANIGLVSVSPNSANAKVDINVTVTGLS